MHASLLIGSALFMRSLATIVTPSASTLDPTITPGPQIELLRKQNNDRYMGWVSISGIWSSEQCESGATYFQSGGHWICCAATIAGCDIPQACVNGNLIYEITTLGSSTSLALPCTSVYSDPTDRSFTICNTGFMYENEQDSSPKTNVNCGISSVNWSYYRVQPEAAKVTSESSAPRFTSAATTSNGNGDTTAANPTLVPQSTEEKSSSKAWIAGVVVGPFVGIALIGFLAWFCIRRKKRSNAAAAAPQATYNPQPQPAAPTGPASPPQYCPPPMQQQGAGMVPFGVTDGKQNTWAPQPQSPVSQASSPNPLSMYGNQYPQQGGHAGPGQPVYNAPSPSMNPPPPQGAYAENTANYQQAHEARPFSSELDGSPQTTNVQPKHN